MHSHDTTQHFYFITSHETTLTTSRSGKMSTIDHYFKKISGPSQSGTPRPPPATSPQPSSSPTPSRRHSASARSARPAGSPRRPAFKTSSSSHSSEQARPGNSSSRSQKKPLPRNSPQRLALKKIAEETQRALPGILARLPAEKPFYVSEKLSLSGLGPLSPRDCPGHPRAAIRVVNDDSLSAALEMLARAVPRPPPPSPLAGSSNAGAGASGGGRVVVLNLANDQHPGGGWLHGASAQEEDLCYRSSLSLALHKRHYPWDAREGLYSPSVVVVRTARSAGHVLLDSTRAVDLPVVSVVSVAAIYKPKVRREQPVSAGAGGGRGRRRWWWW